MELFNLFPIPVIKHKLERDFTEAEKETFSNLQVDSRSNFGNTSSINNEVLDLPEFADLKKFAEEKVKLYFKDIFSAPDSVIPYITLSWANFTEKGQYHHKHCHGNSILSGVLYINADSAVDRICFYNEVHSTIEIVPEKYNIYNSSSWWLPVGEKELLLFPSSMVHAVPVNEAEKVRVSLAFNVFVRGEIGDKSELKWLKI